MSEHMADQNSDDRNDQPVNADAASSSDITSGQSAPGQDKAPQTSNPDTAKAASQADGDTKASATPAQGGSHIMVLPPSRDGWKSSAADEDAGSTHGSAKSRMFGKRRLTAMAAVFALAAVAGVVGGSLASAALGHLFSGESSKTSSQQTQALEDSIRKLTAEVATLKSSAERSAKADAAQLSKVNDRIEKVEKAQLEPAAKLAKLSETVDKLRVAAVPAAPTPAAAKETKEVTGSVPTPVAAPNRTAEVNRLPTVEGWRIRDVANGGALIEGRQGLFEVYAGDPLPGLGRVDAIRRQDGRWVVVTSRGLIVAR